jgi:hypothetical protein
MLKVFFEKIDYRPKIKLEMFDKKYPLPFTIKIGEYFSLPETIYARNLNEEDFIEFRFAKWEKNLYEISIVAIKEDRVRRDLFFPPNLDENIFYVCKVTEEDSLLVDSNPVKISIGANALSIDMIDNLLEVKYYAIAENCFVGVNGNSFLVSLIINGLNEEIINDIFG